METCSRVRLGVESTMISHPGKERPGGVVITLRGFRSTAGGEGMTDVTVRVPLTDVVDLLEKPGRACMSFAVESRPWVEAVPFRYDKGRFLVRVGKGSRFPSDGAEVVLVVDEGVLFFYLRAVYIRGTTATAEPTANGERKWLEVKPTKVSSWDYGRMRVSDGSH